MWWWENVCLNDVPTHFAFYERFSFHITRDFVNFTNDKTQKHLWGQQQIIYFCMYAHMYYSGWFAQKSLPCYVSLVSFVFYCTTKSCRVSKCNKHTAVYLHFENIIFIYHVLLHLSSSLWYSLMSCDDVMMTEKQDMHKQLLLLLQEVKWQWYDDDDDGVSGGGDITWKTAEAETNISFCTVQVWCKLWPSYTKYIFYLFPFVSPFLNFFYANHQSRDSACVTGEVNDVWWWWHTRVLTFLFVICGIIKRVPPEITLKTLHDHDGIRFLMEE